MKSTSVQPYGGRIPFIHTSHKSRCLFLKSSGYSTYSDLCLHYASIIHQKPIASLTESVLFDEFKPTPRCVCSVETATTYKQEKKKKTDWLLVIYSHKIIQADIVTTQTCACLNIAT